MRRWGDNPMMEALLGRMKSTNRVDEIAPKPPINWSRGDIILYDHEWFGPIVGYCVCVDYPIVVIAVKFFPVEDGFVAMETIEAPAEACRRIWPEG